MENEEKKDVWVFKTVEVHRVTAVFDDDVTEQEALNLFNRGMYQDILDDEYIDINESEVVA